MKIFTTTILLSIALLTLGQTVSTLTDVTANGGISVDTAGNLYVAHFGPLPPNSAIGKHIYKITPDGMVNRIVDGLLSVGSGNSYHTSGVLYQSNFNTNTIMKFDLDGTMLDDNFAQVSGPVGITEGPNGSLFICSCGLNRIYRIEEDGTSSVFASSSLINCANGITYAGDGNLYTTNFSDGRILKITPDGDISLLGSTPVGNGHLTYRAMDQHLYIASYTGNRIYKMDLDGNVELVAGTGTFGSLDDPDPLLSTFAKPNGIELSPDGCSLYISQDLDVLREITFSDGNCMSGSADPLKIVELEVFPNPTDGILNINAGEKGWFSEIKIYDASGRTVISIPFRNTIDISNLSEGSYTLQLLTDGVESADQKILIKR